MLALLREDIRNSLATSVPHPKRLSDPGDYAHLAVSILENPYLNSQTIRLYSSIQITPR